MDFGGSGGGGGGGGSGCGHVLCWSNILVCGYVFETDGTDSVGETACTGILIQPSVSLDGTFLEFCPCTCVP